MKQRVFNLIILDESGSMISIGKQAIDSVNETIQTIRHSQRMHEDQDHYISLVVFNSIEVRTVFDIVDACA
ncbi:MAG: VWA domain-containing protein, partial [Muribaculaceae bacterium]|nr:VWA domain-containing protein [Muribaculaceae bacterium]